METKNALFPTLLTNFGTPDAVILAAGDYPSRPELRRLLSEHPNVVCCDSAVVEFLAREARVPRAVVGDLDSLKRNANNCNVSVLNIVHYAEQETNDLSKAVRYAKSQGWRRLVILGATGKREDHTLGNIALLMDYQRTGFDVVMVSDYGIFLPCFDQFVSPQLPLGTAVSIFAFGAEGLKSEGLQYPLHDLRCLWEGTLNATSAPTFSVEARGPFLVYLAAE